MKCFCTFLCLLIIVTAFADQPRSRYSFKSANEKFELKPSDTLFSDNTILIDSLYNTVTKEYEVYSYSKSIRYYWGLYDTETNEKLYTIRNDSLHIQLKTALISDNGHYVIIIDDYSGAVGIPIEEVVHFYQQGQLLKVLTLGDVLENMCSISYSASHMRWSNSFNLNHLNQLKIETKDLYEHTYTSEGELIEHKSTSHILNDDHLIYAHITRIKRGQYNVLVSKTIRGQEISKQEFMLYNADKTMRKVYGSFHGFLPRRKRRLEKGFWRTLHIRNYKLVTPVYRFSDYNAPDWCNVNWDLILKDK